MLYWCALFTATHIPAPRLPPIPVTDKTAHFVSYGLLAIALSVSFVLSRRKHPAVLVLGIMLSYGAIDEWTQIPVHRSCEIADWYADGAGSAAGVVVARLLTRAKFG